MSDHERIWLQHPDDADGQETGRMWCQDKVWPNHPEDHEPTEYVRADLYAKVQGEIARLQQVLRWVVEDYDDSKGAYISPTTIDKVRFALQGKEPEGYRSHAIEDVE